jgi:hypothetical protein
MHRMLTLLCTAFLAGLPSSLHGQAGRTLRGSVAAEQEGAPMAEAERSEGP